MPARAGTAEGASGRTEGSGARAATLPGGADATTMPKTMARATVRRETAGYDFTRRFAPVWTSKQSSQIPQTHRGTGRRSTLPSHSTPAQPRRWLSESCTETHGHLTFPDNRRRRRRSLRRATPGASALRWAFDDLRRAVREKVRQGWVRGAVPLPGGAILVPVAADAGHELPDEQDDDD